MNFKGLILQEIDIRYPIRIINGILGANWMQAKMLSFILQLKYRISQRQV